MARKEIQTLTQQMYYILLVLQTPHHGYEIMQLTETVSKGAVRVGAGTLYALLARFEKGGFICQDGTDGRKKIYVITEEGQELLRAEYERLKMLVECGRPYMEYRSEG